MTGREDLIRRAIINVCSWPATSFDPRELLRDAKSGRVAHWRATVFRIRREFSRLCLLGVDA